MDKKAFIEDLKRLGVQEGIDLLVHSSLRRTGQIEGGADAVIDGLLEALGADGTLLLPTISGCVTPQQPVFHVDATPSSVGALTNVFRLRTGVLRSLHPVHSAAALGPKAGYYAEGHLAANTPWSPETPWGKLMRNNGWVLFLGVNLNCNTCFHALEIEARVPGIHTRESDTLFVIDHDGRLHHKQHHWHSRSAQFFIDMEHILAASSALTYGRVGKGISRLVDAAAMREVVLTMLMEDPDILVRRRSMGDDFIWEP